jgi:hypothetical protein
MFFTKDYASQIAPMPAYIMYKKGSNPSGKLTQAKDWMGHEQYLVNEFHDVSQPQSQKKKSGSETNQSPKG